MAAPRAGLPTPAVAPIAWKPVTGIKAGTRPLLVWIATEGAHADAEARVFGDVDVRLGARAFRVVRIDPATAALDPRLAPFARSAPAAVVFSPDLARATPLSGVALDARTVFGALTSAAALHERIDLADAVARARVLLDEASRLETERAALPATPPGSPPPASAVRRAALDARLATLRTEVDGLFPKA